MKLPDVLVLNKGFIPIHIIEWQRCMSLIAQGAARALDNDFVSYEFEDWLVFSTMSDAFPPIHTVNRRILLPEIIFLKNYNKLHNKDVKYSRQTLFQRDQFICGYCGQKFEKGKLTVDHIIPRSRGGKTTWDNTVTACTTCNGLKADKLLHEAKMELLHKPKKPSWLGPFQHARPHRVCKSWNKFMERPLFDTDTDTEGGQK